MFAVSLDDWQNSCGNGRISENCHFYQINRKIWCSYKNKHSKLCALCVIYLLYMYYHNILLSLTVCNQALFILLDKSPLIVEMCFFVKMTDVG